MKIEDVPLALIKPYWRNPRHNAAAVDAVAQSITDYGYQSPIILDTKHVIIAGHTRYKALQKLGWESVPCVVADMPAAKAKAYRIADNKSGELASWDNDNLIAELREIEDLDAFGIYFPAFDLESFIRETAGSTYTPPNPEQIQKVDGNLERQFREHNQRELENYVAVICPECAHEFHVQRRDVLINTSE
jgi:ParB-like nuclease domain